MKKLFDRGQSYLETCGRMTNRAHASSAAEAAMDCLAHPVHRSIENRAIEQRRDHEGGSMAATRPPNPRGRPSPRSEPSASVALEAPACSLRLVLRRSLPVADRFSSRGPARRRALLAAILCALAFAGTLPAADLNWRAIEPELVSLFRDLVRIDTSNGHETRAAQKLASVLEREGIACKLLTKEPDRANLVARIKGTGKKRPLLLLGHTDTVGVQREAWSVDPFSALRKDGYIYGRGATDDKNHAAASAMVMIQLARHHIKLDRDVIFVAEAGEETGGEAGIEFLVSKHWQEIDSEFALAEGGAVVEVDGRPHHMLVSTTEKVPHGIRLIVNGPAGHGARPMPGNALLHLASAVTRAGTWQAPARLNSTTREYFQRLARISPPQTAAQYRALLDPALAPAAIQFLTDTEPGAATLLRTSIVPTMLKGGFRPNVIPSEAEAYLDVRALPDENIPEILAGLKKVINDPAVKLIAAPVTRPAAPASGLDTEMFHALERVQEEVYPTAPTVPSMLAGATDCAQLRARGVACYGVGPLVSGRGGAHTDDERLPVTSLTKLAEFLWRATLRVAEAK